MTKDQITEKAQELQILASKVYDIQIKARNLGLGLVESELSVAHGHILDERRALALTGGKMVMMEGRY